MKIIGRKLKCSITLEASLIMPVVLLVLGSLIVISFSLYDKVLSRAVLSETFELYTHSSDESDYAGNEARLENCIMSSGGSVRIEENRLSKKLTGNVSTDTFSFEISRFYIRPESMMRAVTLTKLIEVKEK